MSTGCGNLPGAWRLPTRTAHPYYSGRKGSCRSYNNFTPVDGLPASRAGFLFMIDMRGSMSVSDMAFEALRLEVIRLSGRVALLEREVNFLLDSHSGAPYVDKPPLAEYPEVVELKRKGKIMDAIMAYRAQTNAGLAEAKNFVDLLQV